MSVEGSPARREPPPNSVRVAFGAEGDLLALPGGRETSWRVGGVVLKPLDMSTAELEWQHEFLRRLGSTSDVRVSPPFKSEDGRLVVDGWTARRYRRGHHRPRAWLDIIDAGRRLHEATADAPEPHWLCRRTDPWSTADRVAWEELPAAPYLAVPHVADIARRLQPIHEPSQIVHGDLTGNVLFHDDVAALIIDLSPYWRPPGWATAVVVADAIAFEGAEETDFTSVLTGRSFGQYLLRALLFRIVTDAILGDGPPPRREASPYRAVLDLASRLVDE